MQEYQARIRMPIREILLLGNPRLYEKSDIVVENELDTVRNVVTDLHDTLMDCMCFPDLLVKVLRHRSCRITFFNLHWEEETMQMEGSPSELIQHEYDHLEGILAVSRALDDRSFALRKR